MRINLVDVYTLQIITEHPSQHRAAHHSNVDIRCISFCEATLSRCKATCFYCVSDARLAKVFTASHATCKATRSRCKARLKMVCEQHRIQHLKMYDVYCGVLTATSVGGTYSRTLDLMTLQTLIVYIRLGSIPETLHASNTS